jgi:cytochrome c-type biogenesis protein CcmE
MRCWRREADAVTRKKRRLVLIAVAGTVLSAALALILNALNDSIVFFRTPSEIAEQATPPGTRLRVGGIVREGSVQRSGAADVSFAVTDTAKQVAVAYTGILPDLFREGQGVVVEGTLQPDGTFRADTVLAKHDENYVPKEVADALKAKGVWRGADGTAP